MSHRRIGHYRDQAAAARKRENVRGGFPTKMAGLFVFPTKMVGLYTGGGTPRWIQFLALWAAVIVPALAPPAARAAIKLDLRYDRSVAPVSFAAREIEQAAAAAKDDAALAVVIEVEPAGELGEQGYRIERPAAGEIRLIGGDAVGAMYGGLDVAEAIRQHNLAGLPAGKHTPYVAQRGIKFNIPLDLRTPSYSDNSDAAQANIPVMWEREFWTAFLDDMARHRYNVLSLWSLHPFPSLVKVPEFPEVALDDVWRTRIKLDDRFSGLGVDMVKPAMLADHEVVKKITIDEKIEFWRWVMQYAKDRGIDVYFFTWNVFTWARRASTASPAAWTTRSRSRTSGPAFAKW